MSPGLANIAVWAAVRWAPSAVRVTAQKAATRATAATISDGVVEGALSGQAGSNMEGLAAMAGVGVGK